MIKKIDNYSLSVEFNSEFNYSDYLEIAVRENKKRNFLFVSKVLAKHLPVTPDHLLDTGKKLADFYALDKGLNENKSGYNLEDKTLFIGFAETATGLAHSVFDNFVGNGYLINTTRTDVKNIIPLEFKEEHSHATDQKLYLKDKEYEEIILIDDEISTGKTILNIIEQLAAVINVKQYTVLTILDFRNEENLKKYDEYSKYKDLNIKVHSIGSGKYYENGNTDDISNTISEYTDEEFNYTYDEIMIPQNILSHDFKVISNTATQISCHENTLMKKDIIEISNYLNCNFDFSDALILGNEEFIYIPIMIAKYLKGEIMSHSTTRSPIKVIDRENYPIRNGISFKSPNNINVTNYLYNLNNCDTKKIYVIFRSKSELDLRSFKNSLYKNGIRNVKFVFLGE